MEKILMIEISHDWCSFREIPAREDGIKITITSNVPSEPKIKFGRYYKLWKVTSDEWVRRCYRKFLEINKLQIFEKMGISGERPFEKMLSDLCYPKRCKNE